MMETPKRAWMRLAGEFHVLEDDPERAKALCAEYAQAVLNTRDVQRIKLLGAPDVKRAAEGALEGRALTAFAMKARMTERKVG